MSKRFVIIGAGAQAKYVINTIRTSGGQEILALLDTFDNPGIWGTKIHGVPVVGNLDALAQFPPAADLALVACIADPDKKEEITQALLKRHYAFPNIIHPTAIIADSARLGVGCIINAYVVVESDTRIGDFVIIHAGSVIEHDNVIGDYVNLGPRVTTTGRVRVDTKVRVFAGASIIPSVVIGANAVIGAGASVTCDVAPGQTAVGVPARPVCKAEQVDSQEP